MNSDLQEGLERFRTISGFDQNVVGVSRSMLIQVLAYVDELESAAKNCSRCDQVAGELTDKHNKQIDALKKRIETLTNAAKIAVLRVCPYCDSPQYFKPAVRLFGIQSDRWYHCERLTGSASLCLASYLQEAMVPRPDEDAAEAKKA